MATKKLRAYDRQPTDTDKSWAAFCHYRDMGVERSLEKLIQKGAKTRLNVLKNWSAKHNWVERCREFDNDELEMQSIALQKERQKRRIQRERDAENYRIALKNRALLMIKSPLRDNWTEKDIIAMLEASDRFAVISYSGDTPQLLKQLDIVEGANQESQSLALNTLRIIREQIYGWTKPEMPES